MIVGATGHNVETAIDECLRHDFRIVTNLLLIRLERRFHRFLEGYGLSRYHVHQRPTLRTGKDERIELLRQLVVLARNYQAAAGASQRLVSRCRYDVGVRNRAGIVPRCNQARHVCHVDMQISAYAVGYVAKTLPVQDARVR